jgi:hypothetical protein
MERYMHCEALYLEGRKAPIGYLCQKTEGDRRRLFIPGSYEGVTGGCDTIPKVDLMYKIIRQYAKLKRVDVLFEGILAQHSTPSIQRLHKAGHKVVVVVIDIDVERSIRGVESRRKKRGDTRPLNPKNVVKEAENTVNASLRLRSAGVRVRYPKTRRAALDCTLKLLGVV